MAIANKKNMKILIETTEEKVSTQIANFCDAYPTYAALLKADATKMVNLNKGSLFLIFILTMLGKIHTLSVTFTAYKDLLL